MRRTVIESMKMQVPCSSCKKQCVSELLGTYALVFLGPGSVVIASLIPNFTGFWATVFIGSVFGGTVGTMIFFLGKHSGAVINPAVTFGVTLARILHSRYFIPYLFFQVVGGLLAGLTLKILFSSVGSTNVRLGSTALSPGINPVLGFTLEVIGTFVLTTSALLASTRLHKAWQQGLLVGLTLFFPHSIDRTSDSSRLQSGEESRTGICCGVLRKSTHLCHRTDPGSKCCGTGLQDS
jgi:glycerol uptake facilitator-like aquaporin